MTTCFDDSTLFISARSPFARRVRIAFHESGIPFHEKLFDVFQPNPELCSANPLARVPALCLKDGRVLIDSNLILQAFYENVKTPFMPEEQSLRFEIFRLSAIAVGCCEKTVDYHLETLRPKETQDDELFQEIEGILLRSLSHFEATLKSRAEGQPTQADFDVAIALAYLELRHPLRWKERFPACAGFLARMNTRPSFQRTTPPPA